MKTGTLKELNVKPGDVVQFRDYPCRTVAGWHDGNCYHTGQKIDGYESMSNSQEWKLISRATDTPTLWRDMTPEEKGALLLAHHEGKEIQHCRNGSASWYPSKPHWAPSFAYRIKPEPKVEVVSYLMHCDGLVPFIAREMSNPTHRITFNTIDGKPDPASIKMTAL